MFEVWFVNNKSKRTFVEAKNRQQARELFAMVNYIQVSNYIQARRVCK